MGYQIKNYKSCMGTDGYAFSLSLWKDGKRIGVVTQGGSGGPNCYPSVEMERAFSKDAEVWCRANRGWWDEFIDGEFFDYSDAFLEEVIIAADSGKKAKAMLRKKIIVLQPDGTMYEWKRTAHPLWSVECRQHIAAKYPDAVILNDVPLAEAVSHLFHAEG